MRIDPAAIKQQIANLELLYPSLKEDEESWALALESETDAVELVVMLVERIDDTKALAGGVAGRIAELELRLARFEQREKALRALALAMMQSADLKKLELPIATLSVRKGSTRVAIENDDAVPDEFCKFVRSPDKTKIKAHLDNGADVNWAARVEGEPGLTIRTK